MCRAKSLLPLSTNHLSHETIDPPFTNTEPISESAVAAPGNDWLKVLVAQCKSTALDDKSAISPPESSHRGIALARTTSVTDPGD
jgi:hypothetical protein